MQCCTKCNCSLSIDIVELNANDDDNIDLGDTTSEEATIHYSHQDFVMNTRIDDIECYMC